MLLLKVCCYKEKLVDDQQKLLFLFQGIQPDDIYQTVLHLGIVRWLSSSQWNQ